MARVKITWSEITTPLSNIPLSTIRYLDEKGFYAIYLGVPTDKPNSIIIKKLLYIGQAYKQKIRDRLQQPHDADECMKSEKEKEPGSKLYIKSGIILEYDQDGISQELFDDVECCMIYINKPACNEKCIDEYGGGDITISHVNAIKITDSSCEKSS